MIPPLFFELVVRCGSLVRHASRRIPMLEKILRITLSDEDYSALLAACSDGNIRVGEFYQWKIRQMGMVEYLQRVSPGRARASLQEWDKSSYSQLNDLSGQEKGLLICIPHFGPFVATIISLAEALRESREVFVFYDPPSVHQTNEVFDGLYHKIFSSPESRVTVIHNNRVGITQAIKALGRGAAVILMPDVYRDVSKTVLVPFLGRSRNVMLGAAVIARKTGSTVLPVVSFPCGSSFEFKTRLGNPILPAQSQSDSGYDAMSDYSLTLKLFEAYEFMMARSCIYWQYVIFHYRRRLSISSLQESAVGDPRLLEVLVSDPRLRVGFKNYIEVQ